MVNMRYLGTNRFRVGALLTGVCMESGNRFFRDYMKRMFTHFLFTSSKSEDPKTGVRAQRQGFRRSLRPTALGLSELGFERVGF